MEAPSIALHTDRYQLTMLAAYAQAGLTERRAVFELFVRRLPPTRRYLVACGIGRAIEYLHALRFTHDDLAWLARDEMFASAMQRPEVRALLEGFRFRGRVLAIPEGRIFHANEPIVRVEGTLAEAQLVETLLLSIVNHDTRVASKCARITSAARGKPCYDFGTRRTHERAAVDAARAACIAGFAGTSNDEAGRRWGLKVTGTMAHSFVLAYAADHGEEGEQAAFASFCGTFDRASTCLVDTFDTLRGIDRAIDGADDKLAGVRIDSGDLLAQSIAARQKLDARGSKARIVLSNDLDEHAVEALLRDGAPVDAFGIGTMAVATPDAPSLGAVYKLVALEDARGDMVAVQKRAQGKGKCAAPKQVYREPGTVNDLLALEGEGPMGEPLLVPMLDQGSTAFDFSVEAARARFARDLEAAPPALRALSPRGDDEQALVRSSAALLEVQALVDREGKAVLKSTG